MYTYTLLGSHVDAGCTRLVTAGLTYWLDECRHSTAGARIELSEDAMLDLAAALPRAMLLAALARQNTSDEEAIPDARVPRGLCHCGHALHQGSCMAAGCCCRGFHVSMVCPVCEGGGLPDAPPMLTARASSGPCHCGCAMHAEHCTTAGCRCCDYHQGPFTEQAWCLECCGGVVPTEALTDSDFPPCSLADETAQELARLRGTGAEAGICRLGEDAGEGKGA